MKSWNFRSHTAQLSDQLKDASLSYGNQRNYGDCALSDKLYKHPYLLEDGWYSAGITLSDTLKSLAAQDLFLDVLPGTSHVTLGGAIASNVHGKNHFLAGNFDSCVEAFMLQTARGDQLLCSREENPEVFWASFGGMGLTGHITKVKLHATAFKGNNCEVEHHKIRNFQELFSSFDKSQAEQQIAWIGNGNEQKFSGLFSELKAWKNGNIPAKEAKKSLAPPGIMKASTVKLYNKKRILSTKKRELLHFKDYYFPLDTITNWNKAYGNKGFIQFQYLIPKEGMDLIPEIFQEACKYTPFLTVVKRMKANENPCLNFAVDGYTTSMDFRYDERVIEKIKTWDEKVAAAGGKIYLCKDFLLGPENFRKMYPKWEAFADLIHKLNEGKIYSLQSKRLNLHL